MPSRLSADLLIYESRVQLPLEDKIRSSVNGLPLHMFSFPPPPPTVLLCGWNIVEMKWIYITSQPSTNIHLQNRKGKKNYIHVKEKHAQYIEWKTR